VPPESATLGQDIAASRFVVDRYISQHLWPLGDGVIPLRYINIYTSRFDHYLSSHSHEHGDFRNIANAGDLYDRQSELNHVTFL
jgi:hypothetical protein